MSGLVFAGIPAMVVIFLLNGLLGRNIERSGGISSEPDPPFRANGWSGSAELFQNHWRLSLSIGIVLVLVEIVLIAVMLR